MKGEHGAKGNIHSASLLLPILLPNDNKMKLGKSKTFAISFSTFLVFSFIAYKSHMVLRWMLHFSGESGHGKRDP